MTFEKWAEKTLGKIVKTMDGVAWKMLPFNVTGLPDRIVLLPGGGIWFVELKSKPQPDGFLKGRQGLIQRTLIRLGFKHRVVDTEDKFENLINELNEWQRNTNQGLTK